MSELTPNLGLFKYDPSMDGKEVFSIEQALNDNWDILDNAISSTSSLGESGYMKFNNGLIINYGKANVSSQEKTWTRPNLTANGTLGGSTCAAVSSGDYGSTHAFNAFDGNVATGNCWESNSGTPWLKFYTPTAIKISNLNFRNYYANTSAANTPNNVTISASNTDSNYTQIKTYTNTNFGANATWNVPISNNNFYKYFKMDFTCTGTYMFIVEINITATYLSTAINDIIFPCSFTTTNYAYSLAFLNGIFGNSYAKTLSLTGITLQNNSTADAVYYTAIGY